MQQICIASFNSGDIIRPLLRHDTFPILQYANDTLLLLHRFMDQARKIIEILDAFATFLGIAINYHKSTFIPLNIEISMAAELSDILNWPISSMHYSYLGLPLSILKIPLHLMQPIIDKIDRRLSGWMPALLKWEADCKW